MARTAGFLRIERGKGFNMPKFLAASAGLAIATVATPAAGVIAIGNGAGFQIPDNNPAGASSSISVSLGRPFTVVGVQLTGLTHTWAGDLSMTLSGPGGGNSFNFFHRPGQTTPDNFGQNVDFAAANSYSFVDGGAHWDTAQTGVMPSGSYAPIRSPFAPVHFINSFAGLNGVDGEWTLFISDSALGDVGAIQGWSLLIPVPAPHAAGLLGLAGIVALGRRR